MEDLQTHPSVPKWYRYAINLWIFIPAVLYYKVIYQYALDIPWRDDYDAVLNFLSDFKSASFGGKLTLLFSQHNEHRMFPARMFYVLYDAVFGQIDFRRCILIGNVQLMLIFLISVYFIRKCIREYWSLAAFIWGICVFDVNTWENGDVTMTCLSNFGVVTMFFISLFFYSRDKKINLALAVFFQILCMFSSGGGIIGSIFLVLFNLFGADKLKKIFSLSTLLLFSGLYFFHYTAPHPPSFPTTLDNEIVFFVSMMGTHFNFVHGLLFGIILILILFYTHPIGKKLSIDAKVLPFVCILGYVTATIAATSLFRSNLTGSIYWASKYLIYPNLLAAIVYLFIYLKFKGTRLLWLTSGIYILAMLFAYSSNYRYGKDNFISESHSLKVMKYYYPDTTRARMITEKACKAGIYCIEDHRK